MHEAIEQTENQPDVVTHVLNSTTADFRVLNENGLNVLQWAVLKNNKRFDLLQYVLVTLFLGFLGNCLQFVLHMM